MENPQGLEQAIKLVSDTYSPLTENTKADFKQAAELFTLEKSTILIREGEHVSKTYFIVKGAARAFYLKDGKDITDWFAFENEFITSIDGFFQGTPSSYFIELLEPTTFLEISMQNINKLCNKHHDFDRLGRMITTRIMLQLRSRIVSIQFESAQQKYESLLKIRPYITQRVPLTHIASYLGITLETLSRIRNPKNRI